MAKKPPLFEKRESKREEMRESKMKPGARKAAEAKEGKHAFGKRK